MGNKSINNKDIDRDKNKPIKVTLNSKRKKELLDFLLSNITSVEYLQKNNEKQIKNKFPFFPFTSKFNKDINNSNSHFILLSNDIILISTKDIYKDNKTPVSLSLPNIGQDITYNIFNLIIENENYNNNFSIIKVLNQNFFFENYFKIPDDKIEIKSSEKFYINEKKEEESLGINIPENKENTEKKFYQWSPIYIKKDNQLYLIGIITEENNFYLFKKNEFSNINEKIKDIEIKFKLYHIKKLDFNSEKINDDDMCFIFQYDLINLEYLDIQKKNLKDKGIQNLQNNSLKKLSYLNLSSNKITDVGLTYLHFLTNLKELVLLNMCNLSEDYFLSLQKNSFINRMRSLECDKKKLSIKYVSDNYNNFILPNLTCLKYFDTSLEILSNLRELFQLNNLCSRIKELDLSNTGLIDNGMFRLAKNISVFKNIELINLENTKLTTYSKKFFELIHKQKENIILKSNLKERTQKKICTIYLGGSTISGKTTYINTYITKEFFNETLSTIGFDKITTNEPKYENMKFNIFDSSRWNGRFDSIIQKYIPKSDGIILLFDISRHDDFEGLPRCIEMITNYLELEEFPVLLIGNKSDLGKNVQKEEIEQFIKNNYLIGYFEVSSKTIFNVDESFHFMFNYLYKNKKLYPMETEKKKGKK